jgi:uncharacterized membrane protein YeaQ/YmgE (transglycosylase-associated protein family)
MEFGPVQIVQFVRLFDMLGDGWVAIVVYGIFAGLLARFVTAREAKVGLLSSSLLGIVGALLALPAAATIQAIISTDVSHHDLIDDALGDRPAATGRWRRRRAGS